MRAKFFVGHIPGKWEWVVAVDYKDRLYYVSNEHAPLFCTDIEMAKHFTDETQVHAVVVALTLSDPFDHIIATADD